MRALKRILCFFGKHDYAVVELIINGDVTPLKRVQCQRCGDVLVGGCFGNSWR